MPVSDKVKAVLALCGRKQIDLADYFGMTKQTMNNKIARDSWSARDLARVAEFTGCKLAFIFPDGQHVNIDAGADEKGPDAEAPGS